MPFCFYNNQDQKERRKELRQNQTSEEKILWETLRCRKFRDLKFYRQYSVGPYILDFFCPQKRLAIELDGKQHIENTIYDNERENFLKDKNITTIRFWNSDINNNLGDVLNKISDVSEKIPLYFCYNKTRTK